MNAEAEETASRFDAVKLGFSLSILVAAVWAFYHFGDQSMLLRVLGMLAAVALAGFIALQSRVGRSVWHFATDSRVEVRKVVWPSLKETRQTTLIVFIMVLILGIFLWLVDMLLAFILKTITG
jgi:preprotein translocase subunit SecE